MMINRKDDYEALAKLLYPSIEASGNVYYGQTRKLTLDELLKKNSLGFDSHVESFYNEETHKYDSYFCWRLGPLHGTIAVDYSDTYSMSSSEQFSIKNFPGIDSITRILYADSEEVVYDEDLVYDRSLCYEEPYYNSYFSIDPHFYIPIFGTVFARYRLDKHDVSHRSELNSGSFDYFEFDVEPIFDGLFVTDDFNPTNSIDDDISDRHFYISNEGGIYYLYIQILTNEDTNDTLTFIALEDSEISLNIGNNPYVGYSQRTVEYCKYYNTHSEWEPYIPEWSAEATPTGAISAMPGDMIKFRSDISDPSISPGISNLQFIINSGKFFVFGNCKSLIHPNTVESSIEKVDRYAFYKLFMDVSSMVGTPVLPNVAKFGECCYNSMFKNCSTLSVAPKIKSYITDDDDVSVCYSMFYGCTSLVSPPKMIGYDWSSQDYSLSRGSFESMFRNCTSLRFSPIIRFKSNKSNSCSNMFNGCSSLQLVRCGTTNINDLATQWWMKDVPQSGIFVENSEAFSSGTFYQGSGVPEGWTFIEENDSYFAAEHPDPSNGYCVDKHLPKDHYRNDYLVTSGSNSSSNGRGDITDSRTIGNMERSFDETNTHQMDTYNIDGSFNQEIWGYKSFNSPVQFRNGVYGEDWSLYTYDGSPNTNGQRSSAPTTTTRDVVLAAQSLAYSVNPSIQLSHSYNSYTGSTSEAILSSSSPHDDTDNLSGDAFVKTKHNTFYNSTSTSVSINSWASDKHSSIECSTLPSISTITMTADDIQLLGDYGCTYHEYDKDILLYVTEMTCDGGVGYQVNARDRTITISSNVNYDEDNYSKALITTSSKISEPIVQVIPSAADDIRVETSSIDLSIYTTSSDIPASGISLSSQRHPFIDWGSLFETDRSNTLSLKVTDDSSSHNAGTITLDAGTGLGATITIASKNLYVTDVYGHGSMIECNRSDTKIRNKLFLDLDPFSGVNADDDDKHFGFNYFNISVIAIKLASSGNYFVCPNDTIYYQRTYRYDNHIINFTKSNPSSTISISGLTRVTSSSNISDIYLAIMTPSGYSTTEFRLAGTCTFRILNFGRSESSQYIYVLATLQRS